MSAYFTVDDKRRIVLVTGERDDFGEPVETQRTLELQETILLKQQLAIVIEEASKLAMTPWLSRCPARCSW